MKWAWIFPVMVSGLSACPPMPVRVAAMTELLGHFPEEALLHLRRGEFSRALGDFAAAEADLGRALRLEPGLGAARFQLGLLRQEQGRMEEAAFELGLYLEAPGAALAAHPAAARILARFPDPELDEMLTSQTCQPSEARAVRARLLKGLGRDAEAAREFAALEKERPGPDFVFERAKALEARGRLEEAVAVADAGLRSLGSLPVLEDLALDLEMGAGHYGAALRRLERLAAQPEYRERRLEQRALCLERVGRGGEARLAREEALEALALRPPRVRQSPAMLALKRRLEQAR